MTQKQLCHFLEIARWVCIGTGFHFAYFAGLPPAGRLHALTLWLVVPLSGLTGIESIFFGRAASELSGYQYTPAYQRQSGFNNIAVAITALSVYLLDWGVRAEAAVMLVLLIFLVFSACNHSWTAWKENNRAIKNLLRPVMTALLLAFTVPVLLNALK